MKRTALPSISFVTAFAAVLAACGAPASEVGGQLVAPEAREARVALMPALDLTTLADQQLADRIVIDEVTINVTDVRLLGVDPSIPSGGMQLLASERELSSVLGEDSTAKFPFPQALLDDDLSIYVRIGTTPALQGASVVVKGRLIEAPRNAGTAQGLTAKDSAPNPDGEPAKPATDGSNPTPKHNSAPNPDGEPARGAPNPDGEPAHPASGGDPAAPNPDGEPAKARGDAPRKAAPNPDGEPAGCSVANVACKGRRALETAQRSVRFELRGADVVDLVVGFDRRSHLNVLLGVPGARWLTPEVVTHLETLLTAKPTAASMTELERPVVVAAGVKSVESSSERTVKNADEEYRLVEGPDSPTGETARRH